jgi:hypothetical protein
MGFAAHFVHPKASPFAKPRTLGTLPLKKRKTETQEIKMTMKEDKYKNQKKSSHKLQSPQDLGAGLQHDLWR